jgi:hypothetical protein
VSWYNATRYTFLCSLEIDHRPHSAVVSHFIALLKSRLDFRFVKFVLFVPCLLVVERLEMDHVTDTKPNNSSPSHLDSGVSEAEVEPKDPAWQQPVRYSQGDKEIGDAKKFSWEQAVPKNAFWDDLPYTVARNFLQAFTDADLRIVRIDPDSTESKKEKLRFLAKYLKKKLIQEEAVSAPSMFCETDYEGWRRVMLGCYTVQRELDDLAGAEDILRLMIDRRKDKSNLSELHTLSDLLMTRGDYSKAEETAREVEPWLSGMLGKDSPQALSSKRTVILSLWKQGRSRHAEAQKLLKELQDIVAGMRSGQYAVYQDAERDLMKTLMSQMD